MSAKFHESFCFDSFQDRLLFFDDFHGDQVQDEWSDGGNGSAAVVDAQTGGIVRLISGATANNSHHLQWGENPNEVRSLLVTKKITAEYRVKLPSVTDVESWIELWYDATHFVHFRFDDSAGNNWLIETDDGTGPTSADSGETADTGYHIFRIECHTHGVTHAHFFIDGDEVTNSPISTDVPPQYLMPRLYVETLTNSNKTMDTDYVYARQER